MFIPCACFLNLKSIIFVVSGLLTPISKILLYVKPPRAFATAVSDSLCNPLDSIAKDDLSCTSSDSAKGFTKFVPKPT